MSSHREAPEISKDPVADSTDLYAFVSPDRPDTVTLIANYIPLQGPASGPNFFEFGDDVRYEIHISNRGDARADLTYRFDFRTEVLDPNTFLYNTGQITSLTSKAFNRRQFYTVTKVTRDGHEEVLGSHLASPPCNIGPRSTPDYASLAAAAVHDLGGGRRVFAGQRADGFYVDLGSVFDLLDLRPFQNLHVVPTAAAPGVNNLENVNVHSIALQVPIEELTRGGRPAAVSSSNAAIGIWTTAARRASRVHDHRGHDHHGPFRQVSRLGNPLVNEALIPMGRKDEWNRQHPSGDQEYAAYVQHPEVAKLLPVLYPGVFPHLAGLTAPRADLMAILMTGIPMGVVPGFQNFTGPVVADMLRLNVAVPPSSSPHALGVVGGDLAGYPNGRRPVDDVVTSSCGRSRVSRTRSSHRATHRTGRRPSSPTASPLRRSCRRSPTWPRRTADSRPRHDRAPAHRGRWPDRARRRRCCRCARAARDTGVHRAGDRDQPGGGAATPPPRRGPPAPARRSDGLRRCLSRARLGRLPAVVAGRSARAHGEHRRRPRHRGHLAGLTAATTAGHRAWSAVVCGWPGAPSAVVAYSDSQTSDSKSAGEMAGSWFMPSTSRSLQNRSSRTRAGEPSTTRKWSRACAPGR